VTALKIKQLDTNYLCSTSCWRISKCKQRSLSSPSCKHLLISMESATEDKSPWQDWPNYVMWNQLPN